MLVEPNIEFGESDKSLRHELKSIQGFFLLSIEFFRNWRNSIDSVDSTESREN